MTAPWQPATVYAPGDRVLANGHEFECVVGGTSADNRWSAGAQIAAGDIVRADGVYWIAATSGTTGDVGPKSIDRFGNRVPVADGATYPAWRPRARYAIGATILAHGAVWRCVTAGVSAADGGGPGGTGYFTDGGAQWQYLEDHSPVWWCPVHVAAHGGPLAGLPPPHRGMDVSRDLSRRAPPRYHAEQGLRYAAGDTIENDGSVWRCTAGGLTRHVRRWQSGIAYRAGDLVWFHDPNRGGYAQPWIWSCSTAGTSATSPPDPDLGDPQTDGTAQWTRDREGPPGPAGSGDTATDGETVWTKVWPRSGLVDGGVTWQLVT